jgi:hypothetical protein
MQEHEAGCGPTGENPPVPDFSGIVFDEQRGLFSN